MEIEEKTDFFRSVTELNPSKKNLSGNGSQNLFWTEMMIHIILWYVEWIHAVDNPTFTYKEVQCTQELNDIYYSSYHPKP